jgi:hypothetical protein
MQKRSALNEKRDGDTKTQGMSQDFTVAARCAWQIETRSAERRADNPTLSNSGRWLPI